VAGGCHPVRRVVAYLTVRGLRRTVWGATTRRSITLEAEQTNPQRGEPGRLRAEVAELRASRARLVSAADAEFRAIEGELHETVQQQLVALAVKLQLAGDSNPGAGKALLEEMQRDVQQAIEEAARLAQRIYPQLLEIGGFAAALRSAAVNAGVAAAVEVEAASTYAPEILRTVYLCWLEALGTTGGKARATAIVREEHGRLTFEFAGASGGSARLDGVRDRVEALGGGLTVEPDAGRSTKLSGWLPVSADPSRFPPDRG